MFARAPGSRTRSSFRRRPRRADRVSGWPGCVEDRRELVRFWPVVQNMVVQELRVRYQRSILGFFWTLLNPLLMMVILSWVFSHLVKDVDELPALPVRGHGSLELPEHQLERMRRLHHPERRADPEDLPAQAGLSRWCGS